MLKDTLIFRHQNYRLLCTAGGVSNLGDGLLLLALPWLATLVSRNPMHIAWVVFATRVPWFLFSIPVGVLTDRFNRRTIMLIADCARVLLGAGVALVVLMAHESGMSSDHDNTRLIVVISVFAFLLGLAEVFRDNAAQTFLPAIVKSKDLESANGQLWTIEQVAGSLIGPPLAGFLIAVAVPAPFIFAALGFALSAWCLWRIPAATSVVSSVRYGLYREMVLGINWILSHRIILILAIMLGLLNAVTTMSLTVLVLFSQELLGLSSVGHGTLLTAGALGGIAGGLLCPWVVKKVGGRNSVLLALCVWPIGYIGIYLAATAWLVAVILFVEMFAAVLWNVVTVTYRQRLIPDHLLGRVNSIYRCFGWGMMPIGALAAGLLVSMLDPYTGREYALRLPYLIGATCCVGLLFYGYRYLRFEEASA